MITREKTYNIKSPAKINIGLRILSKRKDGFHNIETIFYPIKIHDRLDIYIKKISSSKTGVLDRGGISTISVNVDIKNKPIAENITNKKNICYKAVCLFLEKFKLKGSYEIKINIRKNIPIGAGLGGGSSNAAAVLKVLAKHFNNSSFTKTHINASLQKIALELGSDVSFFLYGKPAYAEGRGEKLTPLAKFKVNYNILIVNPGIHVSTTWAYKQIKNQKAKSKILNKYRVFNLQNKRAFINDFEEPVFKKYPAIKKIKEKMYDFGAVFASMSGSGSTVYGFYSSKKIKAAKKYFSSLNYYTFTL